MLGEIVRYQKEIEMETFEKWWEDANRKPLPDDEFELFKMGGKAALEWVLENLDYSQEHKEIEDKIYKELEKE